MSLEGGLSLWNGLSQGTSPNQPPYNIHVVDPHSPLLGYFILLFGGDPNRPAVINADQQHASLMFVPAGPRKGLMLNHEEVSVVALHSWGRGCTRNAQCEPRPRLREPALGILPRWRGVSENFTQDSEKTGHVYFTSESECVSTVKRSKSAKLNRISRVSCL
jgi:hypothetical protein